MARAVIAGGTLGKLSTRLVVLLLVFSSALAGQGPTVVWREDFEDPAWSDRWSSDFGTWEVGNPEGCDPPGGPGKAHQGTSCLGTIICGNYSDWVDTRFRRHVSFDVPAAELSPRLRFWHWFNFSAADYGRVEIRCRQGLLPSAGGIRPLTA